MASNTMLAEAIGIIRIAFPASRMLTIAHEDVAALPFDDDLKRYLSTVGVPSGVLQMGLVFNLVEKGLPAFEQMVEGNEVDPRYADFRCISKDHDIILTVTPTGCVDRFDLSISGRPVLVNSRIEFFIATLGLCELRNGELRSRGANTVFNTTRIYEFLKRVDSVALEDENQPWSIVLQEMRNGIV